MLLEKNTDWGGAQYGMMHRHPGIFIRVASSTIFPHGYLCMPKKLLSCLSLLLISTRLVDPYLLTNTVERTAVRISKCISLIN